MMSEIYKFMKNLGEKVHKSGQYKLLKQKVEYLSLSALQKRERIEQIIEKGASKL